MFSTFVLFPALGAILVWWHPLPLSHEIYSGFMYLTILPATVQSSIALTSLAGGNVAAAVCSASASSLLGVFISPLLVSLLMNVHSNVPGGSLEQIGKIMLQLLVPFVVGHLSRRWIANWVERNRGLISKTDQASILLVVYSAFSEAVVNGIWHRVGVMTLVWIVAGSLGLLFVVLAINLTAARLFGFNRADEITLLFCGSKESGQRRADGQYPVPFRNGGHCRAATDDLPPGTADGLFNACAALQKTGEKQVVAHEESGSRALARSRKAR